MMKRGDKLEYTDALGGIVKCRADRIDRGSGRIYVSLERSGSVVYFDRFEAARLRQRPDENVKETEC